MLEIALHQRMESFTGNRNIFRDMDVQIFGAHGAAYGAHAASGKQLKQHLPVQFSIFPSESLDCVLLLFHGSQSLRQQRVENLHDGIDGRVRPVGLLIGQALQFSQAADTRNQIPLVPGQLLQGK